MKRAPCHSSRIVSALVIALALPASRGLADWGPNGNRIDPEPSFNQLSVAADPFAGLLVGFSPSYSKFTRVLPSGEVAAGWPVTITQDFARISNPVPDGIAGAYVALATSGDVRVVRLRSDGAPDPSWPTGGFEICNAPGFKYAQAGSDQAGGAYVIWGDGRNADQSPSFPSEVYGTRVLPDGSIAPGWTAQGTLLAAAPESVVIRLGAPRPDGLGGAFAFIQHAHGFLTSQEWDEPFLLHVGPDGSPPPGWPSGGLAPPGLAPGTGFSYEPDGAGGAFVHWIRPQGGTFGSRLLRILSSGEIAPGWPADGVPDVADSTRLHYIRSMAADGEGGVFACVAMDTSGISQPNVMRVHHFGATGEPAADWPADGHRLPEPPDTNPTWFWQSPQLIESDARGGVFAVWAQTVVPNSSNSFAVIGALHFDRFGAPAAGWPEGGLAVCDTPGQRKNVQMVADILGATYVVWNDNRPSDPAGTFFAYASRLDEFDVLAVDPAAPAPPALRAGPNPFRETVSLDLALAEAGNVRLDVLDVSGRIVRRVVSGWLPAGKHARTWDGRTDTGREAPAGLYFVRGSICGRAVGARLVRIR
jgi:flagellar hook capping protein FlgD